jgi:glycosyltransferase involved in cell wall biosynthesis
MKRVLIISYYWPPAGGGGVQRWLKMTKFLPELGWKPIVVTPSNGEAPVIDESLLMEVHPEVETLKIPIWEPYGFYKKLTGKKKSDKVYSGFISDKKEGFTQKLSVFIRGNFFIPDARKFWIKPARKAVVKYLKEHPVDAIISTGPPHTTHLIAYGVTRQIHVPWIADFRDPWTNIDFYDQLRLTKWADRKHRRLEKLVLKHATEIVTVSNSWAKDFRMLSDQRDIKVITNGFDHLDFDSEGVTLDDKFTICHIGSMNKDRNTPALWKALKELNRSDPNFKDKLSIKLIGQVDHSIFSAINEHGLGDHLNHIPFLPHNEAVKHLQTSQLLLLPINDTPNSMGVIPGKLFEYMGAQRPIICIGPKNGDSATIVSNSGAGAIFGYEEVIELQAHLRRSFDAFNKSELIVNPSGVMNYSRKALAEKYSLLLQYLA